MRTAILIPARFNSYRLPGKPLLNINGKSMIRRVVERCCMSSVPKYNIWVVTDDQKICDECHLHNINCLLTPKNIANGTDRIFYALDSLDYKYDAIVNVQGDEPLMCPILIDNIIDRLYKGDEIVTACIRKENRYNTPHKVKVVRDLNDYAMYFSRSLIPYSTDPSSYHYHHIGVYGFDYQSMLPIIGKRNGFLYKKEELEQLRWMEEGKKIKVIETIFETYSVDTIEDYEKVNNMITLNESRCES